MLNSSQAYAFVTGFSHAGQPVTDLSRIRGLMEQLGNPQDSLKFIHIAGTNGKGSAAEYLTGIFMEAGYCVGTFTSPYILRYADRIRVNREDIPDHDLCVCAEKVKACVKPDDGYSQFEITFAIAMLYYLSRKVDLVVLETGMGGLLDCTNIIRDPLACVITTIAMDHMAVLGNTLAEIAEQKAGIIKSGAQVIISPKNDPATLAQMQAKVQEVGANGWYPSLTEPHFKLTECTLTGTKFDYYGQHYETSMGGMHQIANAVTAIETAYSLGEQGWKIPGICVERGIAGTVLPGRLQLVSKYPPILVDGGHNADGIEALADTLITYKKEPIIGIIGLTHGDAADAAGKYLSTVFDKVLCVDGFAPNAVPASELDAIFDRMMGPEHSQSVALGDALRVAKSWAHTNQGMIVVCGSLYLASWFLNGV